MRRGSSLLRLSWSRPSFFIVPGLKFSLTMSAVAIRRSAASTPSGFLRSSAMLFLLRLKVGKKPAPEPSRRRVLSPSIGSTLITSAPRSPSSMPQVGPITMWVNSTTRTPAYGSGAEVDSDMCGSLVSLVEALGQAGFGRHAVDRFARQAGDERRTGRDEFGDVDAGRDAHGLEHEDQVLGHDVARGAGGIGTAAQAAERGVERAHALFEGGQAVREAEPARVVHVGRAGLVADLGAQALEEAAHLGRVRIAHGVGQARLVGAGRDALRGQPDHVVLGHLALQRAAEGGRDAGFE